LLAKVDSNTEYTIYMDNEPPDELVWFVARIFGVDPGLLSSGSRPLLEATSFMKPEDVDLPAWVLMKDRGRRNMIGVPDTEGAVSLNIKRIN
jgi:hypothetical protein